jgi:putative spermidine/putrescine transport system substrate-binding protein
MTPFPLSRRRALQAGIAGLLAAPTVLRGARAAERLVIRTTGGSYDDIMRAAVYDGFTKATGIEVVTAPSPMSKLIAMYKAGSAELDVIDTGDGGLLTLERIGALAAIDYGSWKHGKPDDIISEIRLPTRCANFVYATAMVVNTKVFADKRPTNWAEFWDTKAFPGPRTLPDIASGQAPLEFALIADGVPKDKLYPLDLPRAFRAMTRIRNAVPKFWDTGALSAQMMSDTEAVLGALWNGRVQTIIDKGAPLAIEWNGNMIQVQAYGIPKNTRNMAAAQLFVDYASQPGPQAAYAKVLRYGPSSRSAYGLLPKELVEAIPGSPRTHEIGFYQDITWWEDNRDRVNQAWNAWALG